MADEDWDKLIDSYDRGHRGNSVIAGAAAHDEDPEDLPPPPPPPPPGRGPPPVPGSSGSVPPARQPPAGPPPASAYTAQSQAGSIAAAMAARRAANDAAAANSPKPAVGGLSSARRDGSPPPPPPPNRGGAQPPPMPAGRAGASPPAPSSGPPPPPQQQQQSAGGGGTRAVFGAVGGAAVVGANVVGAAANGLWQMVKSGGGALAPVMQELASVYSPFPDSASQQGRPNLAAIKVVVTAPKIKRRGGGGGAGGETPQSNRSSNRDSAQGFTSPSGLRSPGVASSNSARNANNDDDDDGELWSEANQRTGDVNSRVWLRFIEPKSGSVLYFSTKTNSAQGDRPADYDGSDDDDDDDDLMDGDDERYESAAAVHHRRASLTNSSAQVVSPRRVRAESIILSEAWDDAKSPPPLSGGRNPMASPGGTGNSVDPRLLGGRAGVPPSPQSFSQQSLASRSQPGGAGSGGRAGGGRLSEPEEFVPLSAADIGGKGAAQQPKAVLSLESFLSSSTLYMKQLEQLLAASSAPPPSGPGAAQGPSLQLSSEMELKLQALLAGLQDVQQLIDTGAAGGAGGGSSERGNDVDQLVLLDKLSWDFTAANKNVQRYRRAASQIDHAKHAYNSWHLPSYLSTFPLPPDTKAVTIVVKLPTSDSSAPSDAAGSASTTRIGVTTQDSCASAVAMAFKKCEGKLSDHSLRVSDFVLKGSGIADYMYGDDKRIMDYEYIRMCVRNGEEVKLSLVRRPVATADPESAQELVVAYTNKVDHSLAIQDPDVVYRDVSSKDLRYIPLAELAHLPFRMKLLGVDNFSEASMPRFDTVANLYVRVFLFYGCKNVAPVQESEIVEVSSDPRWCSWVIYKELTLAAIPRGARVGFILCGRKVAKPEKEIMLGWVVHQLVDENGVLTTGKLSLKLWSNASRKKGKHGKPREPDVTFLHRATTAQNLADAPGAVCTLNIQLDEFCLPVVSPVTERYREPNIKVVGPEVPLKSLSKEQNKQFEGLLACDILRELSSEDQILLWTLRHHLVKRADALGKFLQAVDWGHVEKRMEAYRLLKIWAPPASAVSALELLDAKFADPVVRSYAIDLLRKLKDDELRNYLLQLVQCLKFEPYHDSPLKRFLIERALAAPMNVGHYFFWHLKAEVHAPMCCERFGLILEEYLSYAGRFTTELRKQASAVLRLQRIAEMVVRLKRDHGYSDPEAMKEYSKECEKLNRDFFKPMGKFQLPLDPKIEVTQLVVEKCRYMSSKMVPLWLVFKNADPDAPNVYVIFKSGDDLRQDILTLQILTLMDALWLQSGLDCRMKPYKCIATGINEHGEGVGLIEVVLNSDTTSGIQLKHGGGAMGALKMDPLDLFLREHNRIAKDFEKAVDNFVCSCAGYCVATFVLGIGDRHNGNIMVTKDGHLFHIDFGHFLGNFKSKFGINRERAAFVFTPEMAFVMGGAKYRSSPYFKKFLDFCSRAFKTLRVHANLLECLFGLMVAAGMPELIKETDIYYMRDKLLLHEKESKAEKKLNEEIENSLDSKYRRFDNFIRQCTHSISA